MDQIFLSRRNLLTLLSKLDRQKAGDTTACTVVKFDNVYPEKYKQTMDACMVTAVEDDEYYGGRPSGVMHPADDPATKMPS